MWNRIECYLGGAVVKPMEGHPEIHAVSTKPGEYEVRVLRHNRLARTIKFTVGSDGRIVNNGLGTSIGMPWVNFVSVAIHGNQDGPWDKNAWKTEGFYGNLLKGFTPAP